MRLLNGDAVQPYHLSVSVGVYDHCSELLKVVYKPGHCLPVPPPCFCQTVDGSTDMVTFAFEQGDAVSVDEVIEGFRPRELVRLSGTLQEQSPEGNVRLDYQACEGIVLLCTSFIHIANIFFYIIIFFPNTRFRIVFHNDLLWVPV